MSILNKEDYARRRESAGKRMLDNSKIETLSQEQHEMIAEVCTMRHNIHCCRDSMFNSGSAFYSEGWRWVSEIDGRLKEVNLPIIGIEDYYTVSDDDLYNNDDYDYNNLDDEEQDIKREELLREYYEDLGKLNSKIEKWLLYIDEKHGTNYCPTGAQRIF